MLYEKIEPIVSERDKALLIALYYKIETLLELKRQSKWLTPDQIKKEYGIGRKRLQDDDNLNKLFNNNDIDKSTKPYIYSRKRLDELYHRIN